ncbi:MAG: GTP-sensing pleiotropic transcriptional regulator CodY, partial [Selenomonadales bacterium]|nr:GTP-sensing pleiotropic transcriptional regulator CodY [Selenomonadales bacterium]
MIEILEGTRKINKLLHKAEKMNYNEISAVLGNVMEANLYIMDRDGKVLGYALQDGFECDLMIDLVIKVGNFPERYVEWLMSVSE